METSGGPQPSGSDSIRFDSAIYTHVGEDYPWQEVVNEVRQQAEFMDEAGFTTMWLAEHHFWYDGWYRCPPNALLMGADVAANTERLRVGPFPLVLPDWHPIRVAEDVAVLDYLTGGRVDVGVGRGVNSRASIQFNPDADRRDDDRNFTLFRETYEIMVKAWTEELFRYEGEIYTFPRPGWFETNPLFKDLTQECYSPDGELVKIGVRPQPLQRPHPPIWQCSDNPRSFEFAAEKGIGVMSFFNTLAGFRRNFELYSEAASKIQGRSVGLGEHMGVCRPLYIASTFEEAAAATRQGVNFLYEYAFGLRPLYRKLMNDGIEPQDDEADWFDFLRSRDLIWVGTPDDVGEIIERYSAELSCRHFAFFLNIPGLSFSQVMSSLGLFAECVMPNFAGATAHSS